MARGESPFQGRYTVPTVDFGAIERGGAAWGEAYKGVGESIGAGIEKYQLNKQEDSARDARIASRLDWMEKNNQEGLVALRDKPEIGEILENFEKTGDIKRADSRMVDSYLTTMDENRKRTLQLLQVKEKKQDIEAADYLTKSRPTPEEAKTEREADAALLAADVALIPTKKELVEINLAEKKLEAKWRRETDPVRKALLGEELENSQSLRRHRDLQSDNLEAKVEGKAVKLRGVHMPDGSVLPNTGIAPDGKIIDMSTGKPFIMGTFSEGDTWQDVANKSRTFWEDKVTNLGGGKDMFTATDYEGWDEKLTWNVATYDMVVTQGEPQDDGTFNHAWTDASDEFRRVEGWKPLEQLRDGTQEEKIMAKKLEDYRKAVARRDEMPPKGAAAPRGGGGDISEDELNKILDDILR